jgi:hypothetical protein
VRVAVSLKHHDVVVGRSAVSLHVNRSKSDEVLAVSFRSDPRLGVNQPPICVWQTPPETSQFKSVADFSETPHAIDKWPRMPRFHTSSRIGTGLGSKAGMWEERPYYANRVQSESGRVAQPALRHSDLPTLANQIADGWEATVLTIEIVAKTIAPS